MKMNRPLGLEAPRLPRLVVAHVDGLERGLAVGGRDLGVEHDADVGARGDLVDQVARHALLEAAAAVEDGHAAGVRGEEHRRLPGRVAGADDVHVEAVRVRRLAA